MIELNVDGKKNYYIPETWEELSRDQLVAYANLVYPNRSRILEVKDNEIVVKELYEEAYHEMCMGMLYHLIGLPFKQFYQLSGEFIYDMIHIQRVCNFLFLGYDLEENLVSDIRIGKIILEGPKEFAQLSYEEFCIVDSAYIAFLKEERDNDLDEMIACLYRARQIGFDPTSTGDAREPFNQFTIQHRQNLLDQVERPIKIAALIWYECQRNAFIENNAELFDGPAGIQMPLADTILAISGGIKDFDLVRTSSVLLVTADIKRVIKESRQKAEAAKRATQKQRGAQA